MSQFLSRLRALLHCKQRKQKDEELQQPAQPALKRSGSEFWLESGNVRPELRAHLLAIERAFKPVLRHSPPPPLRILVITDREPYAALALMSTIFQFDTFPIPYVMEQGGVDSRLAKVLQYRCNSSDLAICIAEVTFTDRERSLNIAIARKFDPNLTIMMTSFMQVRVKAVHSHQAKMVSLASPERFTTNGLIVCCDSHQMRNEVMKEGEPKYEYHKRCLAAWAQAVRGGIKEAFLKEEFDVPYVGAARAGREENQWEEPCNWRAKLWFAIFRRVPNELAAAAYDCARPEVLELLSEMQQSYVHIVGRRLLKRYDSVRFVFFDPTSTAKDHTSQADREFMENRLKEINAWSGSSQTFASKWEMMNDPDVRERNERHLRRLQRIEDEQKEETDSQKGS